MAKRIICDGCGQPADSEHIRRRIERLELATRFRPIHIGVLFLSEAPPARLEDYFYHLSKDGSNRSEVWRFRFDPMLECCGIARASARDGEAVLSEFQHGGFFLVHAVECPLEEVVTTPGAGRSGTGARPLIASFGATVIQRIQFSYKPRHVILLSGLTRGLIPAFEAAGLKERVLLENGSPLELPDPNDPASPVRFGDGLRGLLAQANAGSATG